MINKKDFVIDLDQYPAKNQHLFGVVCVFWRQQKVASEFFPDATILDESASQAIEDGIKHVNPHDLTKEILSIEQVSATFDFYIRASDYEHDNDLDRIRSGEGLERREKDYVPPWNGSSIRYKVKGGTKWHTLSDEWCVHVLLEHNWWSYDHAKARFDEKIADMTQRLIDTLTQEYGVERHVVEKAVEKYYKHYLQNSIDKVEDAITFYKDLSSD